MSVPIISLVAGSTRRFFYLYHDQKSIEVKVAVAILNWNGKDLLKKFLPSVVENSQEQDTGIFLIDNGSTDDSIAFTNEHFPCVEIVRLEKNYGFAEGYNLGLRKINARYFILVNSDVEVSTGWLKPLISLMDSHPEIAACQPRILSWENRSHFEYAGAAGGYIDRLGFPFCRGRLFNAYEEDLGQYNKPIEVFWATGACLMVRSEVYFECGGLDKNFFAHMEEIDLCWRIRSRGYKIACEPSSVVYHLGAGTLHKANPRKTYLNFRNNLYLLYKNHPEKGFCTVFFVRYFMDLMASAKFLLSFEFNNFIAVHRAHWVFVFTFLRKKAERRENLSKTKISVHPTIFPKSIVNAFFFKGIRKFSELPFSPPEL